MKKIYIHCDGGLGNRLGGIIGGLYLAEKLNIDYEIIWIKTTWCECSYDELFTPEVNIIEDRNFQIEEDKTMLFISHTHWDHVNAFQHHPEQIPDMVFSDMNYDIIYYNNCVIPSFLSEQEQIKLLYKLKIKQSIIDRVKQFIKLQNIDKKVNGLHIRNTDGPIMFNFDHIYDIILKNKDAKYFICSDNNETENALLKLNNVIRYDKTNYVKKINPNTDWNIGDNVYRNSESVIEAFIDMLILSRTNIITPDNSSTFLKFAKLYSKIEL